MNLYRKAAQKILLAAVLVATALMTSASSRYVNKSACTWKGIRLAGKVQVVRSFPDIKVQVVSSFPDLKVQKVRSFPSRCGQWQFVTSFPDFKIQYVRSFPDVKIQFVTSFPGMR